MKIGYHWSNTLTKKHVSHEIKYIIKIFDIIIEACKFSKRIQILNRTQNFSFPPKIIYIIKNIKHSN